MEIKGGKFLVVGLGVSGLAVARFLKRRGADVTVTDIAPADRLCQYLSDARELGVNLELGPQAKAPFTAVDCIVISPGVPYTISPLRRAAEAKIPVMGEIELAASLITKPIYS